MDIVRGPPRIALQATEVSPAAWEGINYQRSVGQRRE